MLLEKKYLYREPVSSHLWLEVMTHWNCRISLNKHVPKFNSSPLKNDALEDFLLSYWDGTLPETNSSPLKNGCLEDVRFSFWVWADFQVRKCSFQGPNSPVKGDLCPRLDLFQTSNVRAGGFLLETMLKLMQINSSSFWSWRIPLFLSRCLFQYVGLVGWKNNQLHISTEWKENFQKCTCSQHVIDS